MRAIMSPSLFRGLLLALTLFGLSASAQTPAAAPDAKAGATTFREIRWDDLMPKDWDPLKDFKDLNLGMLNDGDPKVQKLLKELRASFDNAPVNTALNGAALKLPGYIVPLEESAQGDLREFLLVPYFGACVHTPPPPANQIVHVVVPRAAKGLKAMDVVWVSGTLSTARQDTYMGVSAYRMEAALVQPYTTPRK